MSPTSAPPPPSPAPLRPGLATRLGWVSYFNDCSSEVLARTLPLQFTAILGATPAFVGVVEGLAEFAALFLKAFSGWLSDRARSRKGFVLWGYGLSLAARAGYLLPLTPLLLGLGRLAERVGKGLRSAPRDAMVADAAAAGSAGRDFGVTRFLDTLGSMTGIALVLALGIGHGPLAPGTFRLAVLCTLPLGLAGFLLLAFWVPRIPRLTTRGKARLAWRVPRSIRGYLAIVFLFALANSSDAFLVLKAREVGLDLYQTLALFLVFNALAAALAIPAGRLSDRFGRVPFLAAGWAVYAGAYVAMGLSRGPAAFGAALLSYGAFYGLTEGVEKALLADLLPPEQRGSGYGALQTLLGIAALLASPLMGGLMTWAGSRAAFLATGGLAAASAVALGGWGWVKSRR